MLGLKRGTVALLEHDPRWEEWARQLMQTLREVLGPTALDIRHVGSTAISGICAKPIVDIAVGVADPSVLEGFEPALAQRGIILRTRASDEEGGWLLVTGDFARDTRTSHIHVVAYEGKAWHNYIDFRDYLNHCEAAAREYEQRKLALAAQYPDDRESYTRGKAELIARLLERANAWRKGKEDTVCE